MDPQIAQLVDISQTPVALRARAEMILERARWASQVFQRYDHAHTQAITEAVAKLAHAKARDEGHKASDDAALVENLGAPVVVVPGAEENFKVTRAGDLLLVEAILADRSHEGEKSA